MKIKHFEDRWTIIPPAIQVGLDEESCMEDFEVVEWEIGKGSYGSVNKVRHKQSERVFALKKLVKSNYRKEMPSNYREAVNLELEVSYKVRHPNIVRLHSHFEDESAVYMVMEMVEGQCLYSRISGYRFSEQEGAHVVFQILLALAHIHDCMVIHRDLKPENIMVKRNGTVKILDFGISNYNTKNRSTFCGTDEYLAPEVIRKEPQSEKLDVWTVGVLTFEIFERRSAFNHEDDRIRDHIVNLNFNPTRNTQKLAEAFIRRILKLNPADRPSIAELLKDPFIKKYQPYTLERDQLKPVQFAADIKEKLPSKLVRFKNAEIKIILCEEDIIKKGSRTIARLKELEKDNKFLRNQLILLKDTLNRVRQKENSPREDGAQQIVQEYRSLLAKLEAKNKLEHELSQKAIEVRRLTVKVREAQKEKQTLAAKLLDRDRRIQFLEEILDSHDIQFD